VFLPYIDNYLNSVDLGFKAGLLIQMVIGGITGHLSLREEGWTNPGCLKGPDLYESVFYAVRQEV
jgi:hypothetical protein